MSIEGILVFYRTTVNRALLISVHEFVRGGGLNCEAKVQVLVVTPPPPLFCLKVGRSQKGGGRNSGAVRYMYAVGRRGAWYYVLHVPYSLAVMPPPPF